MALSKAERLQIFFGRLAAPPHADSADEARQMLDRILVEVEDEFSGVIAADPAPIADDGRMYPAQPDNIAYDRGLIVMEHRRHVTYIGLNGAILILSRADDKVLLDVPGRDGKRLERHNDE